MASPGRTEAPREPSPGALAGAMAAAGTTPPDRRVPAVPFDTAVLVVRAITTGISLVLAVPGIAARQWPVVAWAAVVVAYNGYRVVRPLSPDGEAPGLPLLAEVALHLSAVATTGYWQSPFVFSLLTAVIVAGLGRDFGSALRVGAGVAFVVTVPDMLRPGFDSAALRLAVQGSIELVLVAVLAGFARRVTREVDLRHNLALDRLGRLSDANALLYSLHRIAQALPASLALDEVLDSTVTRLRDLFSFTVAAVLLFDETGGGWQTARWVGEPIPDHLEDDELPPALRAAVMERTVVSEPDLARGSGPGLLTTSRSGLYAVMPARNGVVGLLVLEHTHAGHFVDRDAELLGGFVEPAGLAIDNARWFARLRTVGADEERTRIARDLHDRIGQSLAYLAFELDRIVKTDSRGESVTVALERLRNDIRGVIGEVRDTLYDLRTDVSDAQDLPTTLDAFLQRVRERSDLDVAVESDATGRLPLLQEREMWRIAQEAITNVERHARAHRVVVTWWCDGRSASMQIRDDGAGFAPGRAGRLDSYGILGMRERAASIGATLDIDSSPGKGSTVRCLLLGEGS
ncbi:MAG: GAF domain-containing sensor histidine kinase [Actinobacteria bacterium]|nr:GAF domain-containing sensor histidine kinase [Actinomycetota bacterium]